MTNDQERFSENLAIHFGLPEKEAEDPEKRVKFLQRIEGQKLVDGSWEVLEEVVSIPEKVELLAAADDQKSCSIPTSLGKMWAS